MKHYFFTVAAMLVAVTSMAQTSSNGFVHIMSVDPTAEQDKLMYISPNDTKDQSARTQKIVTGIDYIEGFPRVFRMQHFLVECVANQADFSKGETGDDVYLLNGAKKAMRVMPKRAKVVGLALPGYYDQGSLPDFVTNLKSYLFIKNLDNDPTLNPPFKDIAYSALLKKAGLGSTTLYFYNPDYNYTKAISYEDRKLCAISPQSAAHPYVLNMMFDSPFQYDGGFIHLGIELTPAKKDGDEVTEATVDNQYATRFSFPNTQSSFESSTIYHSNSKYLYTSPYLPEPYLATVDFNFYNGAEQNLISQMSFVVNTGNAQPLVDMIFNYFNFQNYTLPAFQLTYYTNDIRGTVLDTEGNVIVEDINAPNVDAQDQPNGHPLIRLYDETDKKYIKPDGVETLNSMCGAEVNEDGSFSFSNLDHTHVYTLSAASSTCGYQEKTINFDTGFATSQSASMLKEINEANAFKNDLVCDIRMKQDKGVQTAITDVTASASPVAIDYYNVAGVRSATPFSGVNIVVTHYSDGTTSTAKLIK